MSFGPVRTGVHQSRQNRNRRVVGASSDLLSLRSAAKNKDVLGFSGFFFISCNLINKPHIKILIVICEVHQFRLRFSHGVLLLRSLEICL